MITKEMIKSVRFCCGYNTNLRVKLPADPDMPTPQQNAIERFLLNNLLGVFGIYVFDKIGLNSCGMPIPGKDVEDYAKLLTFVHHVAWCICTGTVED